MQKKKNVKKYMGFAAGAAMLAGMVVPTQKAKATFGYSWGWEGAETPADSYIPTDNNPFNDNPGVSRGSAPDKAGNNTVETGAHGDGGFGGTGFLDVRNSSRIGIAEEVPQGFMNTPILPTGGLVMVANWAPLVSSFDTATRAGGKELTRLLSSGDYSSSFDIYLNPHWTQDTGNISVWYDPQITDSTGTYVSEGTGQISWSAAAGGTWTINGSGKNGPGIGSFSFVDPDGGWYKLEVIAHNNTAIPYFGSEAAHLANTPDGTFNGLQWETKLWATDLSALIGTTGMGNDYQTPYNFTYGFVSAPGIDATDLRGNRSENFVFDGPSATQAPDFGGFVQNFWAIDNFRENVPLTLAEVPEPASGVLALGGAFMMAYRRRNRSRTA